MIILRFDLLLCMQQQTKSTPMISSSTPQSTPPSRASGGVSAGNVGSVLFVDVEVDEVGDGVSVCIPSLSVVTTGDGSL